MSSLGADTPGLLGPIDIMRDAHLSFGSPKLPCKHQYNFNLTPKRAKTPCVCPHTPLHTSINMQGMCLCQMCGFAISSPVSGQMHCTNTSRAEQHSDLGLRWWMTKACHWDCEQLTELQQMSTGYPVWWEGWPAVGQEELRSLQQSVL